MKKSFGRRIPGVLITVLLTLALILFMAILIKTKLLPTKFLLLAGGIFLLFVICVCLLTRDSKRVGGMITGCLLTMVVLIVLMLGTPYLVQAVDALSGLTQVNVEVTNVGIYVRQDDSADDIADAANYQFGIMAELDKENSEEVISELEEELGTELDVQEFAGLAELVDGLITTQQVDAIVVNSAYLDILGEMEGYTDTASQLRELHTQKVESYVQNVVENAGNAQDDSWNVFEQLLESDVPVEEEKQSNAFTVYISGIDSRKGLISKSRSDVNIIATVNPDTRQVLLVSTPRDFYVPLPISNGKPDKLTHAGIYGIDVSIGTLEMLYDTKIDYYFRVNFSGFEKIVDALDGITVYSDYSFTGHSEDGTSHYYKEGKNKLNGKEALAFARERYAFAEGDRQRGKNQMAVIQGVINKAMSPAILKSYTKLLDSVSGSFETSMPYDKIAELVRNQLDEGGSWNIVSCSVDGTGDNKVPYSMSTAAYVMIPNQETVDAAIAKINQVIDGEILE